VGTNQPVAGTVHVETAWFGVDARFVHHTVDANDDDGRNGDGTVSGIHLRC